MNAHGMLAVLLLLCCVLTVGGCANRYAFRPPAVSHQPTLNEDRPIASILPGSIHAARAGHPIAPAELAEAIDWADVIVLGEQHDDAAGHAVQLAIVRDVLRRHGMVAVSLEMLERDEQEIATEFVAGRLAVADLAGQVGWGAGGAWSTWYQPMVTAARDLGGEVVAANAPRRLVKLARRKGFQALRGLPPEERRLVEVPPTENLPAYRKRFEAVMRGHRAPAKKTAKPQAVKGGKTKGAPPMGGGMPKALLDGFFRAQLVWDATMARSIADALGRGRGKVVHLVGQFHSDFDGATVQFLRRYRPGVRVLVVSLVPADAPELRPQDVGRGDVVIYTGAKE